MVAQGQVPGIEAIPDDLLAVARPHELKAYEEALEVQLALLSPLSFGEYVSGAERPPHIELLDLYLVALDQGRLYRDGPGPAPVPDEQGILRHPDRGDEPVYRLAIAMPPRHGKSYEVSRHHPAWFIARHPDWKIGLASYEAEIAAGWGRQVRDLLVEHGEKFGVHLNPATTAANRWNTLAGGGMFTAGAGGPLTSLGFRWVTVDDPIKNAEEAMSEVKREALWNWLVSVVLTRLEPYPDGTPGRLVLMNTRWHEDDLQGRATSEEPDRWCVLNLPAIAEPEVTGEPDPLGRESGEALWPDRYPAPALRGIERTQGAYWFAAMYQGRPYTEGLGLIPDKFRRFRKLNEDGAPWYEYHTPDGTLYRVPAVSCIHYAVTDLAASTKTRADWSVLGFFAITPERHMLVLDVVRRRMESPDHEDWAFGQLGAHDPRPAFLGVEDKTFGTDLIRRLQRRAGVVIRALKADTDKVTRAIPAGQVVANETVYLPEGAEWVAEFIHECVAFPNAKHDDQVDVLAYAVKVWETIPRRRPGAGTVAVTLQDKVNEHLRKKLRGEKRNRHTVLGRW